MNWTGDFGDLSTHPVLMETNFMFPGQINMYRGKVRDMYLLEDELVVMITTDRLSAFDRVMPRGIPYKGRILSELSIDAQRFLPEKCSSHLTSNQRLLGTNVIIADYFEPIPIEMVVRGFLAGHAAREYKNGKRELCGVQLPDGLKENDPLPNPIVTPTLKGKIGQHDEDISREDIINRGIVTEEQYKQMEEYAFYLFMQHNFLLYDYKTTIQHYIDTQPYSYELRKMKRLIQNDVNPNLYLVDAKYEFGMDRYGNIVLIDEIHTPDSARFFDTLTYDEAQKKGLPQRHMSKEFFRQWLIEQGFQGKEGQQIPTITDQIVINTSKRYIELYERILNKKFVFENTQVSQPIEERIYNNVVNFLKERKQINISSKINDIEMTLENIASVVRK